MDMVAPSIEPASAPSAENSVRPETSTSAKALYGVLAGFALTSLGAVLLLLRGHPQPGSASMELLKTSLQVGVIAVASSFLAVLAGRYQLAQQQDASSRQRQQDADDKERERRHQGLLRSEDRLRKSLEYRHDLLRTILDKATHGYSSVKKARRLLRARGRTRSDPEILLTAVYDTQMEVVNDAQLDFENLQRDVQTSKAAFSRPDDVVAHLKSIDSYLGKLLKEYELERPSFNAQESTKRISELPRLHDFLSPAKRGTDSDNPEESQFTKRAVHAFHDVQRLLRRDLLNPHLAASLDGVVEVEQTELSNSSPEADR